jgi:hypothetical protein
LYKSAGAPRSENIQLISPTPQISGKNINATVLTPAATSFAPPIVSSAFSTHEAISPSNPPKTDIVSQLLPTSVFAVPVTSIPANVSLLAPITAPSISAFNTKTSANDESSTAILQDVKVVSDVTASKTILKVRKPHISDQTNEATKAAHQPKLSNKIEANKDEINTEQLTENQPVKIIPIVFETTPMIPVVKAPVATLPVIKQSGPDAAERAKRGALLKEKMEALKESKKLIALSSPSKPSANQKTVPRNSQSEKKRIIRSGSIKPLSEQSSPAPSTPISSLPKKSGRRPSADASVSPKRTSIQIAGRKSAAGGVSSKGPPSRNKSE